MAAILFAGGWAMTLYWYFFDGVRGVSWGYSLIEWVQCAIFVRLGKERLLFRPLAMIGFLSIVFQTGSALFSLNHWWTVLIINRFFDLALLYSVLCSIFRIRKNAERDWVAGR
ncbi:MAG: hypothetical protein R3C60_13225 [Parvularculaceae bacterium]